MPTGSEINLSPDTFERLIARAIQIDEQGKERIDAVRAREIAADLGISGSAWDAAVREWSEARQPAGRVRQPRQAVELRRVLGAAVLGGVGGTLTGVISVASTGNDIAVAGALIAAAAVVGGHEYFRRSFWQAQLALAAWWAVATPAIMISVDGVNGDISAYGIFSWAGCAGALTLFDLIKRRIAESAMTDVSRV
jgi:hypothetical protein